MIRKYEPQDFKYLNSWIPDAELLLMFSGPLWTFPLTPEQIEKHQEKFPFKQLYVGLTAENTPYAIGELIWNEPNSPRLGRLLIGDPNQRGKGLGTVFIRELMDEFIKQLNPETICLFVFDENISAIKCYEKIGFKSDPTQLDIARLNGKEYPMRKMVYEVL